MEQIIIKIDADLEVLIPGYVSNISENIDKIQNHLKEGDFEKCRVLGHNMKGSGGGYGFDKISEIGFSIETASKAEDRKAIEESLDSLKLYLSRIEIRYV